MRPLLLAMLVLVAACRGPSEPAQPRPAAAVSKPEPASAPPHSSSDAGTDTDTSTDTGTDADADVPRVIRRRCKPGYTPCAGGRDCCDDRSEICHDQLRCQPR